MLSPLSYTGIAGARRVELLSPESESGALTVMRSAISCNGENRTASLSARPSLRSGSQTSLRPSHLPAIGLPTIERHYSAALGTRTPKSRRSPVFGTGGLPITPRRHLQIKRPFQIMKSEKVIQCRHVAYDYDINSPDFMRTLTNHLII